MAVDRSVPGLIVKIGDYPLHHGGVGAIRSLGRLGVPMYAITEDSWTPAAVSRYLRSGFVWPTTGTERAEELVAGLLQIGRRIGRPAVLIPTDEEAAVLIAEHAEELAGPFLFPPVESGLPRRLASKQGLHELCVEHGVPSPAALFPASYEEIEKYASVAAFPLVAKNREAFERRRHPAVHGTTRIKGPPRAAGAGEGLGTVPGRDPPGVPAPRPGRGLDRARLLRRGEHPAGVVHRRQGALLAAARRHDGQRLRRGQPRTGRDGRPVHQTDRLLRDHRPGLEVRPA
ncbi:hypothetical protein GCM10020000_44390 [Streptomyces olivoverticillatus]